LHASAGVQLPPSVVLVLVLVAVLAAIGRSVERRAAARRLEARRKRQREYRRYLRTEGWKQRRQVALDRAAGCCEDCGARVKLEVHHRTYKRKGAERPEDLIAVCGSCHNERHGRQRTIVDWIALALLRRWRLYRSRGMNIRSGRTTHAQADDVLDAWLDEDATGL
jgi:5-methylcytosine-specific restriction endonuclease McrA